MAYNDRYGRMSPGAQAASGIGSNLVHILGGYLGQKLEQDKLKREYQNNAQILGARYPNMPKEQIAQYSQLPAARMPEMVKGLGASEFSQIMSGGGQQGPGAPQQQQVPQDQQQQRYGFTPENLGVTPSVGAPQTSATSSGRMTRDDKDAIYEDLNELEKFKQRIDGSNLDPQQRMTAYKYHDARLKNAHDVLINQEKLKLDTDKVDAKRALDDSKAAIEREKFERKNFTEDRAHKVAERNHLDAQFGKRYAETQDSRKELMFDKATLIGMQHLNNDPKEDFGSKSFNTFADFIKGKLGVDISGFKNLTTQQFEKKAADMYSRIPKKFTGAGKMTQKAFETLMKKYASVHQSPEARAIVIKSNLAEVDLELKRIDTAQALYKKNNYQFVPGFFDKVEKQMDPHYQAYIKKIVSIPDETKKNKVIQEKERKSRAGSMGGFLGGVTGAVAGGLKGAGMGAAFGGIPGAVLGGMGGLAGGFGGAFVGENIGRYAEDAGEGLANVLSKSNNRQFDMPR